MDCKEALSFMNDYLDGERQGPRQAALMQHVQQCASCRERLMRLETVEALTTRLPKTEVPDDLTAKILGALPKPKRQRTWFRWVKNHPAASVAAVFVIVMMSSFLTLWNQDTELMVRGKDLDQVEIYGDTVIVPKGTSVDGDLVVENGRIQVEGRINGNVTVIDGSLYQASTANISGKVTKIDQTLDWIWYKVEELYSSISK